LFSAISEEFTTTGDDDAQFAVAGFAMCSRVGRPARFTIAG